MALFEKLERRIKSSFSYISSKNMAATTKSRPKASAVTRNTVQNAGSFLETLPDKPKEELSLRESMGHLREPIQAALAKGYSYQDLADLLGKQGISISATTLKNYVPSGKRQAAKEKKATASKTTTKRGRKPKASSAPAPATPDTDSLAASNGKAPSKAGAASSSRKTTATKAKTTPTPRAKTSTRTKSTTTATASSTRGRRKKTV
jgi:hypothetical protein